MSTLPRFVLILFVLLTWAWSVVAQPALPKPVVFGWEQPDDMGDVIGWRFQWDTDASVDLPIYQTIWQVDEFPLMLRAPVSVYSLSSSTNSIPTTIYVYNVFAHLEGSGDALNWGALQSAQWTGDSSSNLFFRVRLEVRP